MTNKGTEQPLVSVVIATYNMAQHLGEAIESVLGQSYRSIELHVIDDGSTDGTAEVVQRYAGDERMHYVRQTNAGQTAAKNRGVAESRGQFIAFCDADDIWKPNKLELQLPLFAEDPQIGVIYSNVCALLEDGTIIPRAEHEDHPSGNVLETLFTYNFVPFGTAVLRRDCLDELGAFDSSLRMGIDWDLWLRIATRYKFRYLDVITYVYRVWSGQMSKDWRGRYEHSFRIMHRFLENHPNALPANVINRAFAHSYVERARVRSASAGEHLQALADIGRALRKRPSYLPAWKLFGRVGLNVIGVRDNRPRVA